MKPEYDQWAENLLQEIYYTPEEHRVALVKEHLLKAVQRGYVDGWWIEQDKNYPSIEKVKQVAKELMK